MPANAGQRFLLVADGHLCFSSLQNFYFVRSTLRSPRLWELPQLDGLNGTPRFLPDPCCRTPPPPNKTDKRDRIIVVVRSPCQEKDPADAHTSAHKSMLESANPAGTRSVHLDAPGQWHGQQPVSGRADPGVVKHDKSSRGSVDTTKRRADPQRVGMHSGERPNGAANGKQTSTMASCQTSPPPLHPPKRPSDFGAGSAWGARILLAGACPLCVCRLN